VITSIYYIIVDCFLRRTRFLYDKNALSLFFSLKAQGSVKTNVTVLTLTLYFNLLSQDNAFFPSLKCFSDFKKWFLFTFHLHQRVTSPHSNCGACV
jgi:hypothetical protein